MAHDVDLVLLTEDRYVSPHVLHWYNLQVLLEDELLAESLRKRSVRVMRLSWRDPAFDWRRTQGALFRSTWDYFSNFGPFQQWLREVSQQTTLFNSETQIQWNLHKRYLLDLQDRGVLIVPTTIWTLKSGAPLVALMAAQGWNEVVIKPVVSGAARRTFRLNRQEASAMQPQLSLFLAEEDFLVQPFMPAIQTEGEISVMVMAGVATHAVKKMAKSGDFRVQDDHGGTVIFHPLTEELISVAQGCVAACEEPPLYARVDLVRNPQGHWALMELELIEPELFFRFHRPAADALAEALVTRLESGPE
jgi:glutathione synthase/RimK-type ligase-like ATP-grasp enzyme